MTPFFCSFSSGHPGVEQDLGELLVQAPLQHRDQVAVAAGQQAVGHLHHRDLAAEGGIDRAQLQADVAAADDQQGGWARRRVRGRRWSR